MANPSDTADLNLSTIRSASEAAAMAPTVRVLTILCHPDVSRIGDRSRLDELAPGRPVSISRTDPRFAPPEGGPGAPLADPYISRQALEIAVAGTDEVVLSAPGAVASEIEVDGRPFAPPVKIADYPGTVILLSRRVVLFLHREPLGDRSAPDLGLIGRSAALEIVRRNILDVAPLVASVLVRGESGTGKELVARAIHDRSGRAPGPFVAVNMGTLTPALAGSALFGHARGAFTDAREAKPGLFARADGGTLFLDEIGQTPVEVQAGLLRALENREVHPVGADRPRRVDVRIVAATDANLERAIAAGRFMEALFHRLAQFEIGIPPLRERTDDLGRLLVHFLREALAGVGASRKLDPPGTGGVPWLPAPLVARLARYPWPGNVRELRNAAAQMAVSSHRHARASAGEELERRMSAAAGSGNAGTPHDGNRPTQPGTLRPAHVTEDQLLQILHASDWKPARAAAELGISRTSLYALMEKHGLRKGIDLSDAEILRCREECGGDLEATARRLRVSGRALVLRLARLDRSR